MAICRECGSVIPDTTRFCPGCGTRADLGDNWRPDASHVHKEDGVKGRAVSQPSRPERQRAPMEPLNERKPVQIESAQPRQAPQAGGQRGNRPYEEAERKGTPVFDDMDAANEAKRRPARQTGERPLPTAQSSYEKAQPAQPRPARQGGKTAVISVGEYFISMLLSIIPVIGLVLGIMWTRGANNPNKRNFGKAAVMLNIAGTAAGAIIFVLSKWVLKA